VLLGPATTANGRTNLFGALRRTMAKTGYRDLKEFQRVDLVIGGYDAASTDGLVR
jgi:IMP dehydrogenase